MNVCPGVDPSGSFPNAYKRNGQNGQHANREVKSVWLTCVGLGLPPLDAVDGPAAAPGKPANGSGLCERVHAPVVQPSYR